MNSLTFETRKRLEQGDLGEEVEPGFFMADLGRSQDGPGPSITTETVSKNKPKTRAEREQLADRMAAQLMDYYMEPGTLNNATILNPIRDGIPQCSRHRFVQGDSNQIGCIYGCGAKERDHAGNLPVARDGSLGDAWEWVRALVRHAVLTQDKRLGYGASGVDLKR